MCIVMSLEAPMGFFIQRRAARPRDKPLNTTSPEFTGVDRYRLTQTNRKGPESHVRDRLGRSVKSTRVDRYRLT